MGLGKREGSFTWVGRMEKLGPSQPALRDSMRVTGAVSGMCKDPKSAQTWPRGRPGEDVGAVGCLWQASPHPSIAVSPAHALAALLMAVRVVLLKVLLSDAVFTSILLAQS